MLDYKSKSGTSLTAFNNSQKLYMSKRAALLIQAQAIPWVDNTGKSNSFQLSSDQTSQQIHNYDLIKWLTFKRNLTFTTTSWLSG